MNPLNINSIFLVRKLDALDNIIVSQVCNDLTLQSTKLNLNLIEDINEISKNTLIIAIGGDGTMLYAMKLAAKNEAFVIGVNLGKLGFLVEHNPNSLLFLTDIISGDFQLESRSVLSMDFEGITHLAMNEITITHEKTGGTLSYSLKIGNMTAGTHKADGVIISTPTGSTGYALSTGGAILDPSLNVIEIIPLAPLTITSRPLIIPNDKIITISPEKSRFGNLMLRADGQEFGIINNNDIINTPIIIKPYQKKSIVLRDNHWNFYTTLTAKLGWNRSTF